MCAQKLTRWPA